MCSKIPTISAVQVFSLDFISPVVSFLWFFIYSRCTYFHEHMSICYSFFLFFLLQCVTQEFTVFIFLFLQKIRSPLLASYKRLLSIVIDKFIIIEFAMLIRNLPFLVPPSTLAEHIYGVSVIIRKYILQISPGCLPILLLLRPILQIR